MSGIPDAEARDEAMAENVRSLALESPAGKIVFRGHNGHASANGYFTEGRRLDSVGRFLRRDLGDALFAIGTTSSRGTYHAFGTVGRETGWSVFPLPAPPLGSWEGIFDEAGHPRMIIPLTEPLPEWARTARPFFNYITVGRQDDEALYAPPEDLPILFDAVIYVEETTPTQFLH